MGTISRASGTPYVDGDILPGARLESDISSIYTEFNGGISSANLADSAVSTAKIADSAVVAAKIATGVISQAKLVSGAATASEAQSEVGATGYVLTTSFATVGTTITHVVGDPARHVVIFVSFLVTGGTGQMTMKMLKDGVTMTANQDNEIHPATNAEAHTVIYIDTAPTAGGTHIYTFQAKRSTATASVKNLMMVAIEPRS